MNDVLGLVIYPDGYTGSTYTTGSDWSDFEAKGCVFLPAAWARSGNSVTNNSNDEGGTYWSSTAYNNECAYCMLFGSEILYSGYWGYGRANGFSVRLVHDVE